MASVEEVRAAIMVANDKASESITALQQAISALEQAQGAYVAATQGSNQSEANELQAQVTQLVQNLTESQNGVTSVMSTAEGYAARL